ncbi:MAG: metallophosphoesterase [Candidatus Pacearchaeota archaeon]
MKKEKKIKILAAGDIHGGSKLVKKLAEKAKKEDVDLIILTGDILGFIETKNIIKPLKDTNKKILLIHGNHEDIATIDFLSNFYNVKNLHGYALKYKNVGIIGAGGAVNFNTTEKELFETLKKANKYIQNSKKKIIVTHMHPAGSKSEFSGFTGSKAIRKAIEKFQPDILIHSHIHEAEGIEGKIGKTKIINVGRKGKIIEI